MIKQTLLTDFALSARKATSGNKTIEVSKKSLEEVKKDLLESALRKFENTKSKNENKEGKPQNLTSYKSYTQEQKEALLSLKDIMSPSEIQKKFAVDESTFRGWIKNDGKPDVRKVKVLKSVNQDLESELLSKIKKRRENAMIVDCSFILKEIKSLFMQKFNLSNEEYNMLQNWAKYCSKSSLKTDKILFYKSNEVIISYHKDLEEYELSDLEKTILRDSFLKTENKLVIFDGNWLHRFVTRYNISYRRITSIAMLSPQEKEVKVIKFLKEVHELREEFNIPLELILNFDEVGINFETIPKYSYELKGVKHPPLKANLYKKRLTVGLCASASGEKLLPLFIFQGQGSKINSKKF